MIKINQYYKEESWTISYMKKIKNIYRIDKIYAMPNLFSFCGIDKFSVLIFAF